ncbi:MAG TPA: hypothetical protein VK461_03390, partial [Acidimicrobiales bacterium]|nr:hypothetical protein [Acidimicrobiales bacterium]
ETFGLTADDVAAIDWAEPTWADGTQPRAAAAAWIIESGDARIVVDPALAADDLLRNDTDASAHQQAFASLLERSGFPRETITHAVATHFDGIGMLAWRHDDGSWAPFFPNAPVLYSACELEVIDAAPYLGESVQPVDDRHPITDEVMVELTAVHSPGHQIVRIESEGERATIVGHLALVPLNLAVPGFNAMPEWNAVSAIRDEGALLIGPLWPSPGAGRWDGRQLVPA